MLLIYTTTWDKPERRYAKSKEPGMKDLIFYLYEIFRKGNSVETENRLMWLLGGNDEWLQTGFGESWWSHGTILKLDCSDGHSMIVITLTNVLGRALYVLIRFLLVACTWKLIGTWIWDKSQYYCHPEFPKSWFHPAWPFHKALYICHHKQDTAL